MRVVRYLLFERMHSLDASSFRSPQRRLRREASSVSVHPRDLSYHLPPLVLLFSLNNVHG